MWPIAVSTKSDALHYVKFNGGVFKSELHSVTLPSTFKFGVKALCYVLAMSAPTFRPLVPVDGEY